MGRQSLHYARFHNVFFDIAYDYKSCDAAKGYKAWALAEHPLTDMSIAQFQRDWTGVYGAGKCVYNLKSEANKPAAEMALAY